VSTTEADPGLTAYAFIRAYLSQDFESLNGLFPSGGDPDDITHFMNGVLARTAQVAAMGIELLAERREMTTDEVLDDLIEQEVEHWAGEPEGEGE
jgi:hypothetical protein